MTKNNKKIRWLSLLAGCLLVISGIIAFINPVASYVTVAIFIGIFVLVAGIIAILSYLLNMKKEPKPHVFSLIIGILDIVLAIVLLSNKFIAITLITLVVGVWLIVSSFTRFIYAYHHRDVQKKAFIFSIITGLISVIIGFIFIFNITTGAQSIVYLFGVYLILAGVIYIVNSFGKKDNL